MGKQAARIPAFILSVTLFISGALTLLEVRRQTAEAGRVLAERESEARTLRREIEQLREENAAADERERTEQIARSKLGLLYPDEKVIFILGD